jgi:hypothetical protein
LTKHELAATTWQQMKQDLIDRGALDPAFVVKRSMPVMAADESELVDQVIIAMIENSYLGAVAAVVEETEDRLCLADNARLAINKPHGGRILVDSSAFSMTDGHVVLLEGQEMVIREKNGQVFITRRQG